jgi:hypothetical protein
MERKYSCRPASIYYTNNNNRVQAGGEGGREASIFLDCKMYSFFFAFVNCELCIKASLPNLRGGTFLNRLTENWLHTFLPLKPPRASFF